MSVTDNVAMSLVGERHPFTLHLFSAIDNAQKSHGIPHQDYSQYSKYCTAKLSRLRHAKPVRTLLVHNPKYSGEAGTTGGKRKNVFAKRDDRNLPDIPHVNVLWNQVYQAERAWAQACALQHQVQQSSAFVANQKSHKSKHGHVQRRLNKAVKHAEALVALASREENGKVCDDQSIKECEAYLAWMTGNAELEHKKYASSFHAYKKCLVLLLELSQQGNGSMSGKDEYEKILALQDLWSSRAETVVRPLVRYCQHEAKNELTRDDLQIPITNGAVLGTEIEGGAMLSFRNKLISLEKDASNKELAVLYLKMESSLKHPELLVQDMSTENNVAESQFLQLLSDLDDAIALAQAEYHRYEKLPPGPNVTSKRQEVQTVMEYFRYQKLNIWRYQQEARIRNLEKDDNDPEVMVHAYDGLLQNGQAIAELLKSSGDGDNITSVDETLEEDNLWLEAQAHVVRIRAFRCFYLARLYESSPSLGGTSKQVLGLLMQAKKLTIRATEEMAAIDDNDDEECQDNHIVQYQTDLEKLTELIDVMTCRVQALRFIENAGGSVGVSQTKRPLWLRLEELDAGEGISTIADDPPLPLPMPCKGSFYDIAWQHISTQLPLQTIEQFIADNEPKKQSSGFLGWLTGGGA